jgi:hypothetical protein
MVAGIDYGAENLPYTGSAVDTIDRRIGCDSVSALQALTVKTML